MKNTSLKRAVENMSCHGILAAGIAMILAVKLIQGNDYVCKLKTARAYGDKLDAKSNNSRRCVESA